MTKSPAKSRKGPPLEGVRVTDFCWAVAGPVTTKFLAVLGAEVIKVESRSRLDGSRLGTPFLEGKPGVNKSGYFTNHNMSKLSIRLDMTKPEARDIARRLVATSDVVTESFSAGVIGRWGLDYQELSKVKPDLVMISLTMQGQTGPYATHVGFGRTLSGLAGIDHLTGWPEGNPGGPNQPYTDLVVPWFGATAVMTALRHRDQTGRGQYIDLAQLETALHFLAPAILQYSANGQVMNRDGNRSDSAAPHGVYPCQGERPVVRHRCRERCPLAQPVPIHGATRSWKTTVASPRCCGARRTRRHWTKPSRLGRRR